MKLAALEPWQMTKEQFGKEKRRRRRARAVVAGEAAERKRISKETGFPVGCIYGLIEALADLPALEGISHKRAVMSAARDGKPVPEEVLAEYAPVGGKGVVLDTVGLVKQRSDVQVECNDAVLSYEEEHGWIVRAKVVRFVAVAEVYGDIRERSGPWKRFLVGKDKKLDTIAYTTCDKAAAESLWKEATSAEAVRREEEIEKL